MFIDKELEAHRLAHEDNMKQVVPLHTKKALDRYVHSGIKPGGFLTALLANDLFGAYRRADSLNIKNMFAIVKYVYNEMPIGSWGDYETIKYWSNNTSQNETEQS